MLVQQSALKTAIFDYTNVGTLGVSPYIQCGTNILAIP